ncbi:DMT family transporter [Candidatus Woesearchaeota archaeon]|nr:DMT family transporter [Candidatus Woesearchaeota archaeon]
MDDKKGLRLVLLTAIISGFSVFLNRFGVSGMNSYVFVWLKNSVVAVLLASLLLSLKRINILKKLTRSQWSRLILIGLVGGSVPFLLFFRGLQIGNAVSAAFIHKTMFIWVALLSMIILRQKLSKKLIVPAGLILLGNLLVMQLGSFSIGTGEIMILAATLLWSAETLISKRLLEEVESNIIAFGRMFFGSLFVLAFLVLSSNIYSITALGIAHYGWVVVTSILLLGYVITWYNGLKNTDAVAATSVLLLGSPITTLLNFVFVEQMVAPVEIAGIVILIVGVGSAFVVLRSSKSAQRISTANPR